MEDRTVQFPGRGEGGENGASNRGVPAVILYDGDEIGALHSLVKDETIIGRTAGCDIVIPEVRVSRRHAVIARTLPGGDQFEARDLDSTNGTFLNGERIERSPLTSGDKLGIGDRILKFAILDRADLAYQSRIAGMIDIDDLTGLVTLRSLLRAFDKELIRSIRYRRQVSVLMMDLDHFKKVNDTYGHLVGSHCLSEVGRLIRESTRVTDVNGRYGGEEFLTFLPETDLGSAMIVAERIRDTLARRWFKHDATRYQVQISIGVSTAPQHGTDAKSLIKAADMALYLAKTRGRNRSVAYEPDLPLTP